MSKRRKQGKRTTTGQVMAATAHKAKVDAMRGNFGAPGARAWTAKNGKGYTRKPKHGNRYDA